MSRAICGVVATSAPAPVAAIMPQTCGPKGAAKIACDGQINWHIQRCGNRFDPIVRFGAAAHTDQSVDLRACAISALEVDRQRRGSRPQDSARQRALSSSRGPDAGTAPRISHHYAASVRRPDRAGTACGRGLQRAQCPRQSAASCPPERQTSSAHRQQPRITPIWCHVSGKAWQNVCTALAASG